MTHPPPQKEPDQSRKRFYRNGRLYFSKKTERNFFFVMTLLMLALGILAKMGFF